MVTVFLGKNTFFFQLCNHPLLIFCGKGALEVNNGRFGQDLTRLIRFLSPFWYKTATFVP